MSSATPIVHEAPRAATPSQQVKAQALGAQIFARYAPQGHSCFAQITQEDVASAGGKEGFVQIFTTFYEYMLADTLMSTLFDFSKSDVPRSASEHGQRLGLWYLARYGGDNEYMKLRGMRTLQLIAAASQLTKPASAMLCIAGGNIFGNIGRAHQRAIRCPLRPGSHHGVVHPLVYMSNTNANF